MATRRNLLVALGAGALAAPLFSFAQQQGKVWRIGHLSQRARPTSIESDPIGGLPQKMREFGYVEGKNLVIEWRFIDGGDDRLAAAAAELVQLKVDVILTNGTQATRAAQKTTATIPIVMATINDPVGSGFVKSLSRPGGNITGVSNFGGDVSPKLLEMLRSMTPSLSRVAVLSNSTNPSHPAILKSVQAAAQQVGAKVLPVEAQNSREIESAFAVMVRERAGGVIVLRDSFFSQQVRQMGDLALKHRLPSILGYREYPEAGGLMSYGASRVDSYQRAAIFVDKIFKGAKPGDLPVEQPTTLELVINRKTAKALGLKIPQSLLIMADKVIE